MTSDDTSTEGRQMQKGRLGDRLKQKIVIDRGMNLRSSDLEPEILLTAPRTLVKEIEDITSI
jgi:hypothetical protein